MPSTKETVPERIRSPKVILTKSWLDDIHKRWHMVKSGEHSSSRGEATTLEEFGKRLAIHVGRPKPFAANILGRFFTGESTNKETLDALCSFFEIPSPLLTANSIAEVEWFVAGQALSRVAPEEFQKFLVAAQAQVVAKNKFHKLEQELGSNPDDS